MTCIAPCMKIKANEDILSRIEKLGPNEYKTSDDSDEASYARIKELEELVEHKDRYYEGIYESEKRLREAVDKAGDFLIDIRGSNSIDFISERIERAIDILNKSLN